MGFTGAGIAASSLAAKMMSAAAVANGGGVAAGSLVATLQSVGAAGLSTSSNILLASVGSAFGAWLGGSNEEPSSPPSDEPKSPPDEPKSPPDEPKSPPNDSEAEGDEPEETESQIEPPNRPLSSEKQEK
ncbi:interferon alpha-inducible protein 27-like protein 2A [Hyaena hyaena]|uniref:interferon alpha-inducible protein 27-like protein 2A n=1 Tax=Hyaena hyaena TaxID=95912 RepID=UPI0019223884|nr:interferon alpha-inducible protein 27-like protein 2A [Hyaena hyaena]